MSLTNAIRAYRTLRAIADDIARDPGIPELRDPNRSYDRTWLAIFATGGMPTVVMECRISDDEGSALREFDPSEVGQPDHAQVFASSLPARARDILMPMTRNAFYIGDRFKHP